nr:MAG TPA: hypothetical protein [Caudoviricetes sp.]
MPPWFIPGRLFCAFQSAAGAGCLIPGPGDISTATGPG